MGLRGRALQQRRKQQGIGQHHIAKAMGVQQPEVSIIETEKYGGMPRGFSTRFLSALAEPGPHFDGCGCKKAVMEATA